MLKSSFVGGTGIYLSEREQDAKRDLTWGEIYQEACKHAARRAQCSGTDYYEVAGRGVHTISHNPPLPVVHEPLPQLNPIYKANDSEPQVDSYQPPRRQWEANQNYRSNSQG